MRDQFALLSCTTEAEKVAKHKTVMHLEHAEEPQLFRHYPYVTSTFSVSLSSQEAQVHTSASVVCASSEMEP